jgi:DNA-binding winged helix-turn-helix (wHTH) protein
MDMESRRDGCGVYEVGRFLLDVPERQLTCGPRHIHLAPQSWSLLVALVTRPHRLVTKRELPDRVWPDVFVTEGILTVHVAALRRAFGDSRRAPRYIETVSRGGYRFIADVRALTTVEASRRGVRRCLADPGATPVHSASVGGGV